MHKKLGVILTLLLCMGMVFSTPVYAEGDSIWKKIVDKIIALIPAGVSAFLLCRLFTCMNINAFKAHK